MGAKKRQDHPLRKGRKYLGKPDFIKRVGLTAVVRIWFNKKMVKITYYKL